MLQVGIGGVSGDLCDVSQSSASRFIKRVSEGIARLKNTNFIQFSAADLLVAQIKLDFWRICAFSKVVERIDCTHMKIQFPGGGNAEMLRSTYNKKKVF